MTGSGLASDDEYVPDSRAFDPCFTRPPQIPTPSPEADGCRFVQDIAIPMRDGTRLAGDLYLPLDPSPHPLLLERSPYGKHSSVMVNIGAPQALARAGFAVAIVDVRGRYASEGAWYPFADDLGGDSRDGYDTIEWLAAQSFCNGKVGTFGGSYAGFNQYTLSGEMPPHLVATFPRQAPTSMHSEWVYRGGALEFAFMIPRYARRMMIDVLRSREVQYSRQAKLPQLDLAHGWPLPSHPLFTNPYQWIHDYTSRQEDEAYWRQFDIEPHFANFNRPSLHVASWFDIFCGGTLRNFIGMRAKAANEEQRNHHKLVIGPWIHGPFMAQEPEGRITGEMDCGPGAVWDYTGQMREWFSHWLKNAPGEWPTVRYFVMGVNEWRESSDWPPPESKPQRMYLSAGNSLTWQPPTAPHQNEYHHDPHNPIPSLGGAALFNLNPNESTTAEHWADLNAQAGSRDQRPIEGRCLVFTSEPLQKPLTLAGPVTAHIRFSATTVDADLIVRLCDVYPDGRSMLLCDGIQRARYRNSPFQAEPLTPGDEVLLKVDLWATANVFQAGHCLRVIISGASYPRFDINPGTGASMLDGGEMLPSQHAIHCSPERPSYLELSIIPSE